MSNYQNDANRGVQGTGLSTTPLTVTQKKTTPPAPSGRAHA